MFFVNTLKIRKIEHDGVIFCIKPMDCYQQLDYFEKLDELKANPKKIADLVKWVVENHVTDIEGLKNEDGEPVDFKSMPLDDFIAGLSVGKLNELLEAVAKSGMLAEDEKKKL